MVRPGRQLSSIVLNEEVKKMNLLNNQNFNTVEEQSKSYRKINTNHPLVDDITHFEYTKKVNRENDVAVVGIQLKTQEDLQPLITKLKAHNFFGDYLNDKPELFQFLV